MTPFKPLIYHSEQNGVNTCKFWTQKKKAYFNLLLITSLLDALTDISYNLYPILTIISYSQ